MDDEIHIESLELESRIGVTAEERALPQRLTVSLVMEPARGFNGLSDQIERTVDYAAVCETVKRLAGAGERNLIETLAEEIAVQILKGFDVSGLTIELRKYVLPVTEFVAVRISRRK
jgi:dihydroneopterin aldolase